MRQNGWQRGTVDKPFVPCMKMHGMEGIFYASSEKNRMLTNQSYKIFKKAHDIKEGEQR